MDFLETVLWPIAAPMEWALIALHRLTDSMGLAIVLLAVAISLLLAPLRRLAGRIEQRITARLDVVKMDVATIDPALNREERFYATEAIYERHGYHPIQTMALSATLMVMLPVFVSAIVVIDADTVGGYGFAFIRDLGAPDGLLPFDINLLPFFMTGLTVIDARLRFSGNTSAQWRFAVIAVVLLALVYPLSAGLIVYWTTSNLTALALLVAKMIVRSE